MKKNTVLLISILMISVTSYGGNLYKKECSPGGSITKQITDFDMMLGLADKAKAEGQKLNRDQTNIVKALEKARSALKEICELQGEQ